jgi:hypothetical protein
MSTSPYVYIVSCTPLLLLRGVAPLVVDPAPVVCLIAAYLSRALHETIYIIILFSCSYLLSSTYLSLFVCHVRQIELTHGVHSLVLPPNRNAAPVSTLHRALLSRCLPLLTFTARLDALTRLYGSLLITATSRPRRTNFSSRVATSPPTPHLLQSYKLTRH